MASSPQEKKTLRSPEGPNKLFWLVVLGLAAASLLLLATVVGLGVLFQQVSQQLQEVLPASMADNSSLARRLAAEGESLWQRRLQHMQDMLAAEEKARREMEEALNATRAEACPAWCPDEWVLFRGKCLFFSRQRKTWEASKNACEKNASQLLITRSWGPVELPGALQTVEFWVGLRGPWSTEQRMRTWVWVDGSHDARTGIQDLLHPNSSLCAILKGGSLSAYFCRFMIPYVCEKTASALSSRGH